MLKWLKNYIEPPANPEANELRGILETAKAQHGIALDNYHLAVEKMLKRMDRAERVIKYTENEGGGSKRQSNDGEMGA
jgi:coenzyme F420-reducing hydrogenase alpha subunit